MTRPLEFSEFSTEYLLRMNRRHCDEWGACNDIFSAAFGEKIFIGFVQCITWNFLRKNLHLSIEGGKRRGGGGLNVSTSRSKPKWLVDFKAVCCINVHVRACVHFELLIIGKNLSTVARIYDYCDFYTGSQEFCWLDILEALYNTVKMRSAIARTSDTNKNWFC